MPDPVVDLAGDARALGQGGGAQLVVLHLEHPGVRVLQGQDPLAQVVAGGVQVLAGGLPLPGAQRQQRGDRPQGRRVDRGRLAPAHRRDHDRGARGGGC